MSHDSFNWLVLSFLSNCILHTWTTGLSKSLIHLKPTFHTLLFNKNMSSVAHDYDTYNINIKLFFFLFNFEMISM